MLTQGCGPSGQNFKIRKHSLILFFFQNRFFFEIAYIYIFDKWTIFMHTVSVYYIVIQIKNITIIYILYITHTTDTAIPTCLCIACGSANQETLLLTWFHFYPYMDKQSHP